MSPGKYKITSASQVVPEDGFVVLWLAKASFRHVFFHKLFCYISLEDVPGVVILDELSSLAVNFSELIQRLVIKDWLFPGLGKEWIHRRCLVRVKS